MISTNKQIQESGDSSTNLQAGRDIHVGLSYHEARVLFVDLFEQNFIKLRDEAKGIAETRVREIVEEFLLKAQKDSSINFDIFKTPAMQSTFYNAQVGYAKSGDENVKEQLIGALLERAKIEESNTQQIILDEAIEIIPKLTKTHINYLSFLLMINYTKPFANFIEFQAFFNFCFCDLYDKSFRSEKTYNFLDYLNLTSKKNMIPMNFILNHLLRYYTVYFSNGFSKEEFTRRISSDFEKYKDILINCFQNNGQYQFNAQTSQHFEDIIKRYDSGILSKMRKLYQSSNMTQDETINLLYMKLPKLADHSVNYYYNYSLTPIGTAIAILNLNKNPNINLNLSDYI